MILRKLSVTLGHKRPVWTVRLNMTKNSDFKIVNCHARSLKASMDSET